MSKVKSYSKNDQNQQYWLFKSEPSNYSFQNMENDVVTNWGGGIRNYQAQNFMKTMKVGDMGFFYHSITDKSIVGIIKVYKEFYNMSKNGKFGQVDIQFKGYLNHPVELKDIKKNPKLNSMLMLTQRTLSVSPLTEDEWNEITRMSEV